VVRKSYLTVVTGMVDYRPPCCDAETFVLTGSVGVLKLAPGSHLLDLPTLSARQSRRKGYGEQLASKSKFGLWRSVLLQKI
jgi:hypothetical protein